MKIKLHKNCQIDISNKDDGNMAFHIPIDTQNVQNNRTSFIKKTNLSNKNVVFMNQTHSDTVVVANEAKVYDCDAFITDKQNIALAVMVADCIPIFYYDPVNEAYAAIHAGRVGTFKHIGLKTLQLMHKEYGTEAKDLIVYIGPSIGKCCYEVSKEMADIVKRSFGKEFVTNRNIDLKAINKNTLIDEGVVHENIIVDKTCTKCYSEQFYSYRQEKERSGRFIGIISKN